MKEFPVELELDKRSLFEDMGDAYHDLQQQDEPYISSKGNGEPCMAVKGNWWALQTMTIGKLSLEMESLHKTKTPELDKMPKGKKGVGQKWEYSKQC